jgi:hypothetical protein
MSSPEQAHAQPPGRRFSASRPREAQSRLEFLLYQSEKEFRGPALHIEQHKVDVRNHFLINAIA